MAMNVGPSDGGEDETISTINTTPLVDVMLVLLIIFLITIPVVVTSIPDRAAEENIGPDAAARSADSRRWRRQLRLDRAHHIRLSAGGHRQGRVHHRAAGPGWLI